jgi:predicted secreted protein
MDVTKEKTMNPMIDLALWALVLLCSAFIYLEWPRIRAALDELDRLELEMIKRQIEKEGRNDG